MNSLQCICRRDNAESLRRVDSSVLRSKSLLMEAVENGRLCCVQVIYERCPDLLYRTTDSGVSLLHHAAYCGRDNIVEFLLYAQSRTRRVQGREEVEYIKSGTKGPEFADTQLLMMVNRWNHTALHDAVGQSHFQSAKLLVEANSSKMFLRMETYKKDTALHIAVRNIHVQMVKLLVDNDSSGDNYTTNEAGHTPHVMALEESSSGDPGAVEIRRYLIEKQPSQCRVRTGNSEWTLLHHATFKGNLDAINEIMQYCPSCVEMVDIGGQNFIHLAAKYGHEHVITHILQSTSISENVFNWQDNDGNTPLHLATSRGNAALAQPLLYDRRTNVKIRNKQGRSALEAITFDYDKRRALYGFTNRLDEKEIKSRSDFDLLVGALICTVSFTSGITVPGGFSSDGPSKGNPILYQKLSFEIFMVTNTIAFALSLYAVFSHFCMKHLEQENYVIYQLRFASFCSLGAIFALMAAFISGSFAVMAVSLRVSVIICGICCLFFVVASHPMWTMVQELRQRQLSGNGV